MITFKKLKKNIKTLLDKEKQDLNRYSYLLEKFDYESFYQDLEKSLTTHYVKNGYEDVEISIFLLDYLPDSKDTQKLSNLLFGQKIIAQQFMENFLINVYKQLKNSGYPIIDVNVSGRIFTLNFGKI